MGKVARLIMVTSENNNKFYDMTENTDGTFTAHWGRVGAAGQSKIYPMSDWDKTLYAKTHKSGESYVDITSNAAVSSKDKSLNIKNPQVKNLIDFLMNAAKKTLSDAYLGSVKDVTQKQIDLAQDILDRLAKVENSEKFSVTEVNEILLDLYRAIPRKMADTRYYLLKDKNVEFLRELLVNEQNLLNTLSTQTVVSATKSEEITLESLGFDVEEASDADRARIAKETDFKVGKQRIFRVTNKATEKAFRKDLTTKLLYHGSRNENWLSILMNGLKIRPAGVTLTGAMFGNGIYAANKAQKSIGYTSLKGSYWTSGGSSKAYLAIFEFAVGKTWNVLSKGSRYAGSMSSLDLKKVQNQKCDSVFAEGGADLRNDEYIVYDPSQCTVRYLIELTA